MRIYWQDGELRFKPECPSEIEALNTWGFGLKPAEPDPTPYPRGAALRAMEAAGVDPPPPRPEVSRFCENKDHHFPCIRPVQPD